VAEAPRPRSARLREAMHLLLTSVDALDPTQPSGWVIRVRDLLYDAPTDLGSLHGPYTRDEALAHARDLRNAVDADEPGTYEITVHPTYRHDDKAES